jgi:hypothetical protein
VRKRAGKSWPKLAHRDVVVLPDPDPRRQPSDRTVTIAPR